MSAVISPFVPILALNGAGLSGGRIYIGAINQDPEIYPQPVYWDEALTIPAAQPLSTVGGIIYRVGSPAVAYTLGAYSLRVADRQGVQIYYEPNVSPISEPLTINADGYGVLPGQTASANATNLNAMIVALHAAGGGIIAFSSPAAYPLSGTVTIRSNVGFEMVPGSYFQWSGPNAGPIFESDSTTVITGVTGNLNINEGGSFTGSVVKLHSGYRNSLDIIGYGSATGSTLLEIIADSSGGETAASKRNHTLGHYVVQHTSTCGTLLKTSGVAVGYDSTPQVVTLNTFEDLQCNDARVRGWDVVSWTDTNTGIGDWRLSVSGNNSGGVEYNSGAPTGPENGVYNNLIQHLAVDTFNTYTGRFGVKFNLSKGNVIGKFFNDPVAEAGAVVVGAGGAAPYSYLVNKMVDSSNGMEVVQLGVDNQASNFGTATFPILATDTATSYSLAGLTGTTLRNAAIIAISGDGSPVYGLFYVKPKATGAECFKIGPTDADNAFIVATTGILTGTTGTANRFTVSAATNGNLYFENRLPTGHAFSITVMSGGYRA